MLLRHLHLPGTTPYAHASDIQQRLVSALLAYKANPVGTRPPPTIITAEFRPVYTCGRREVGNVSAEQIAHLTAKTPHGRAEFHEALRGGQTTFHGPGQLVAYPILDLKQHGLGARDYVCLLEKSVIQLLRDKYSIESKTTDNPGVWVDDDRKICALGVHLRRNVSSHGIGLNVSTELAWFDRIVACGLEGKRTTSMRDMGVLEPDVEVIAEQYVGIVANRLSGVEKTERIQDI
ncbi:lipoate-protein ligase-like protein B [Dissoconium aciculare CBS 342.82]|uniref:Octanoyltransferase n=1 Tax=Dissoconium aciculare CBS 342.82 TaxID=1314786 RepID=A0A6J3M9C1_9PEZI|nr:lipoate-protein ligase-like protein B [Dissoconium aciculare CBS 342.82]KAF1824646.1 lipoate-protein ligase-like protein B [Dissoconium aciculare CBS 342.82]